MEEQKTNKKITIGIVAVLLIVLVTIGETYAYFSAQAETGTQTVTTGTLSMNFDKAGSAVTLSGIVTSTNATHFLDNPITSMFIPETVNASNSSYH